MSALVRAYHDALLLHVDRRPVVPPPGSPLKALDAFETVLDLWLTEYGRLRSAYLEAVERAKVEAARGQ